MNNSIRKGDWLQTYSGRAYWLLDPRPEEVSLDDIAHHLSLINRFNGATLRPWPVSAHALLVSHIAEEIAPHSLKRTAAIWGLHHDDHEAYFGDWIKPVKNCFSTKEFDAAVEQADSVIALALELPPITVPVRELVKYADIRALVTEVRDLLVAPPVSWADTFLPWPEVLTRRSFQSWESHKAEFLLRHNSLMG